MQAEELAQVRRRVETEIAVTEAAVARYGEMSRRMAPDGAIGRVSRLDALHNKSMQKAALRQTQGNTGQLRHLLTTLHEPGFGRCALQGHAATPLGRPLLLPVSRFCVPCGR